MPNLEDVLSEKTFKQDGLETSRRVFYTIDPKINDANALHKTTKLLGILIEKLESRGILSEDDIDAMLLEIIT